MKRLLLILFVLLPTLALAELVPVRDKSGKFGYKAYSSAEKFTISPKFDGARPFVGEYAFACYKGLWGVIKEDGKFEVKPCYTTTSAPYGNVTIVGLNGKYGLAIGKDEKTPICYDKIEYLGDIKCFRVYSNGKQGLINGSSCEAICEVNYDYIKTTAYGAILVKLNNKYGLMNKQGELTIPITCDSIESNIYETFLVKVNGKCGLLDKKGRPITSVIYDSIEKGAHNTFLVKLNGKCGLLNKGGETITAVMYDSIAIGIYNNTFLVKLNGKCGIFTKQGQQIIPIEYDLIKSGLGVVYLVYANNKCGLFNQQGRQIVPAQYDSIEKGIYQGTLLVKGNDKCGMFSQEGQEIVPVQYDSIEKGIYEGALLVKAKDKYGVFSQDGQEIVPVQYDGIEKGIYEGTLLVKAKNKYGVFNQNGQQVVPIKYDAIEQGVYNGTLLVKVKNKCGIFSQEGQEIVPVQYDDIKAGAVNTFLTTLGDKNILLNAQGKFVTEQKYKQIVDAKNGVVSLFVDKGWQFFDVEGKKVPMPKNVILYTTTDGQAIEMHEWDYYHGNWHRREAVAKSFENSFCDGYGILVADNDINEIKASTFRELNNLKNIQLPGSVKSIGNQAFYGCKRLTDISMGNSVVTVGDNAFENCWSLLNVVIPDSTTSIGRLAFLNCYSLVSVTIGKGVTTIGGSAFYECKSLKNVHIADLSAWCKVDLNGSTSAPFYYGAALYLNNKRLTELVIPSGFTKVDDYLFCGCSSLESVTISDSVATIGKYAFWHCENLTNVTIGNSVSKINDHAFRCSSLESVYYNSIIPADLGDDVFFWDNANLCIYVPQRAVNVYKSVWSKLEPKIYGHDFHAAKEEVKEVREVQEVE